MLAPTSARSGNRRRGLLLCLVLTTGCHSHGHEHGHGTDSADAEPPAIAVTVWSEAHEVFAEFTVPVLGEPSRFATHVSDLRTGQPRREGPVTYRLRSPSGEARDVVDERPARDGLYLTQIELPHSGTWRLSLDVPTAAGVDRIELGELPVYGTEGERDAATLPEGPEGISFLKEQQWLLGTVTERLSRHTLEERVTSPGRIRAAPDRSADVVPPVAGRLVAVAEESLPGLGDDVAAGELLAWIEPPLFESLIGAASARSDLARAEVQVELLRARWERVHVLAEKNARSPRELEEAEFALRAAEAARDGARRSVAAYDAAGITGAGGDAGEGPLRLAIRAPIDGVVDEVLAVSGQSVTAEEPILRILDTRIVHVEAHVRDEVLPRVELERGLRLVIEGEDGAPVAVTPPAVHLVHVGLRVDERTGRVPVVFAVDNPDGTWRPGAPVDVSLPTGRDEWALAVPSSTLIEEETMTVAYVQLGGEIFERRRVTTGLREGHLVQVLDGLAEGERVVTDGAYAVRLASVSTTEAAHGHAH